MQMSELLTPPKTIAVVGLSDKPERPSYTVAKYLMEHGFTIIPVNPMLTSVLGLTAYPSLADIPHENKIDIVDIFRRSEEVMPIVEAVLELDPLPVIWMQEGVISPEAKALAESRGATVMMDICIRKEHLALVNHSGAHEEI